MKVLSLFDGISCGLVALERAGVEVTGYFASEVDPYAIQISKKNHPKIHHLGDINNFAQWDIAAPDIIIGGSPCQGFSFAGKQLAFKDPRSVLFFKFVEILGFYNPKFFLLENVRMKKEYSEIITCVLGVEPICINSALVSAQNRVRYYWTNIQNIAQPEDKGIFLKDIIDGRECHQGKSQSILASIHKENAKSMIKRKKKGLLVLDNIRVKAITENNRGYRPHRGDVKSTGISELGRILKPNSKTDSLTTSHMPKLALNEDIENLQYRKLLPIECERLQTLPDNYTEGVSNTQRYKMLGNGWTIDVLAHIFKNINNC